MAITLGNLFKTGALDGALATIAGGTGDATGDLEFLTSADVSLAVLLMNASPFGAATIVGATSQALANAIVPATSPTSGTIAKGRLRNKANVPIISWAVSLAGGGGDMIAGTVVIPSGATSVSCSGITITASFA